HLDILRDGHRSSPRSRLCLHGRPCHGRRCAATVPRVTESMLIDRCTGCLGPTVSARSYVRLMQMVQETFDDLGVHLSDVTFVVVDLETTGGSPADCGITEIGAVKVR